MAGFLLQLAEPLVLLAFFIAQVVVGEVAPLLLGFAFDLVPVASGAQLGAVARSRGVVGFLVEPVLDVINGLAGFLLQLAEPFVLAAFVVGQVVVGQVAPFLLGLAFDVVPVAASFELGAIADVIVVNVHD